ncbi:lipid A deacylase LpxR family protein [Larsenimonas suaedae]|uniref:Lipid A deacylase LpxR family protein n=1 Tax=Larsenimonas suaedae TaxID=1851019 RepID=A0ABU1GY14_9GAMM|nr:lipid A deacylase LpxR family protein [Larsenimonas suaedae]MCM2972833.1 lipid A deacylase LpxR family protein [Larsenimonas suaedae]MDR5896932.1 lipid A deacylase LpxR family protein [Larsenimonas suaedae]
MRAKTLALLLLAASPSALADGILTLKVDNDIFASGDDGHYTNGLEGQWTFRPAADHWTRSLSESLPVWSRGTLDMASYRFGQQIYTPENTSAHQLIESDRPYAGYLYAGLSLFQDERDDTLRQSDSLYIDIGVVGPAAGGKFIQNNFHHLIDSDRAEGWHNQLSNEPTLAVGWNRAWWHRGSIGSLETEYGPNVGVTLGNLYDFAETGYMVRVGRGLSDVYGIPNVSPSQSGRTFFTPNRGGWYVFAGLTGRYVAHNMLLDGNTFEDSAEVDRRPLVGDALTGVALTYDRWSVAFTAVWRTHEFEAQDDSDKFGSLTISTWL